MVSKPMTVGSLKFATKGDATAFFRAILHRYRANQKVSEADALDLTALLALHPECAKKTGVGIAHFEVARNIFKTKSFWVVRVDGTEDDFSIGQCISPKSD